MKLDKRPANHQGSVFLLALRGMEIVYVAGRHEITSRIESEKPKTPQVDPVASRRRDEKRG